MPLQGLNIMLRPFGFIEEHHAGPIPSENVSENTTSLDNSKRGKSLKSAALLSSLRRWICFLVSQEEMLLFGSSDPVMWLRDETLLFAFEFSRVNASVPSFRKATCTPCSMIFHYHAFHYFIKKLQKTFQGALRWSPYKPH